ncbi:unannotated protein [freshwater metagenome]|uniref:Unannotated protein n=1 Tax=freshwater metagenome TaxID=449393 RepID=A0A6J6IS42_9ZZZZ|nr:methyltransferase domain-containing protein [Actinomycetota bacterium]
MTEDQPAVGSAEWSHWRETVDLDDYANRWKRMAESGQNPHGEADFVSRFEPSSVLDAGCGMGRVAIELATRGYETVGVDLDPDLLLHAQQNAPTLVWHVGDLSDFDLGRTFDVVVAAGNVIGFVDEANRSKAVWRCAAHVAPGGRLITGYSINGTWPAPHLYDGWCADAGLELEARYSTWDGDPFQPDSTYAVTVHRRPV